MPRSYVQALVLALAFISGPAIGLAVSADGPAVPTWSRYNEKLPADLRTLPEEPFLANLVVLSRDDRTMALVTDLTLWHHWYGERTRLLARITQEQFEALVRAPEVLYVEPDHAIVPLISGSAIDVRARSAPGLSDGIWSFEEDPGLGSLRSATGGPLLTGAGVTVAVIDSGIDRTHLDFGGWHCTPAPFDPCESRIKVAVKIDQVLGMGVDPANDMPTTDLVSGHGTHVAGTIAGNGYYARSGGADPERYGGDGHPIGIAPEAFLVSVSVGDSQSAALGQAALEWTLDHADEYGIKIASNSWGCAGGCEYDPSSPSALVQRDLYRQGVLVVFAAGNDGGSGTGVEFSGYSQSPYVVSVGNYDHHEHRIAPSSSRGEADSELADPATWEPEQEDADKARRPDIAAPGTDIWAARSLSGGTSSSAPRIWSDDVLPGTGTGIVPYATMSGTSMATPHTSGVAALLAQACPSATPLGLMRALFVAADPARVLNVAGTEPAKAFEAGYGALDALGALEWLRDGPQCDGFDVLATPEARPPTPATAPVTTSGGAFTTSSAPSATAASTKPAPTASSSPAGPSPTPPSPSPSAGSERSLPAGDPPAALKNAPVAEPTPGVSTGMLIGALVVAFAFRLRQRH